MSEPSLSDREQAILASLAARAEAEDPRLARMMRGGRRLLRSGVPPLPASLGHWWWGAVLALVGLVGVLGLLAMSPVGAGVASLLVFAGVGRVLVSWPRRRHDPVTDTGQRPAPSA